MVCVAGRPEFLETLRRTIEGKQVDAHPVVVSEFRPSGSRQNCRLVYVATNHRQEIAATLAAMGGTGALTIGESAHFLELGGSVKLAMVDGRVTFQANLDALEHAGISISSKLLRFGQLYSKGEARRP
jgi:hypothetical protein